MKTLPNILYEDGIFWWVENVPEKPDFSDVYHQTLSPLDLKNAKQNYERALASAIEKKLPIVNAEIMHAIDGTRGLLYFDGKSEKGVKMKEGELYPWPGTAEKTFQYRYKFEGAQWRSSTPNVQNIMNEGDCDYRYAVELSLLEQGHEGINLDRFTEHAQKLEFTNQEIEKTKAQEVVSSLKTEEQWIKSKKGLNKFLKCGDEIDERLYNYIGEIVAPHFCNEVAVQCGEPFRHDKSGIAYHETAIIDHGRYYYLGILPAFKTTK